MPSFTLEDRLVFVQTYYETGRSITAALRKLRSKYGPRDAPNRRTLERLVKKFEATKSLEDQTSLPHRRPVRTEANIAAVRDSIEDDPNTSTRRRSQELNISRSSLQRILHDLQLRPYKVQLTQALQPADHESRRQFADRMLAELQHDQRFFHKIFFSDEAHFYLSGYVNKQNCRVWGSENPQVIVERPLHPKKVTVWCAMWAGGIVGPFFFENEENEVAQTVNADRYCAMMENFFWPELDALSIHEEMWFQQDGAPSHTAGRALNLIAERFPGRVISRGGDISWPPRSCDLTPLDYFLWGFLKDNVYRGKPTSIRELKAAICDVLSQITPEICGKVIKNYGDRINICKLSRGGHLSDIVFHT
jgi:hypothetical protein